ncbi:tudor domain-containing protein 15 [Discoglossus pictus]
MIPEDDQEMVPMNQSLDVLIKGSLRSSGFKVQKGEQSFGSKSHSDTLTRLWPDHERMNYSVCQVNFHYIAREDFDIIRSSLETCFRDVQTLPGTHNFHNIKPLDKEPLTFNLRSLPKLSVNADVNLYPGCFVACKTPTDNWQKILLSQRVYGIDERKNGKLTGDTDATAKKLRTIKLISLSGVPGRFSANKEAAVAFLYDKMETSHSVPKHVLNVDLKISLIECSQDDVLVNFHGKYNSECEFDYHILQNEIQHVPKEKVNIDIGEFCLAQEKQFGAWHRGKVVDKINEIYEVLLIDQGDNVKINSTQIASAFGELFTLPPKIVKGIFSNILPVGDKWSSKAINFFSSLVGLQVKGHIESLLPHQVVLLEIPKIISNVVELNLAKYVDSTSFRLLIEILHKFPLNSHCKQMPDLLQQNIVWSDFPSSSEDNLPSFQKILDHLRPQISVGITQKVKISAAISPNRFYCHFLPWEEELNNLTTTMCAHYEAINKKQNSVLENFGALCAAKRRDGLWHRGVIQKIISGEEIKVFFIDFGSSEIVLSANVQKLQPEFLSLPMMAVPCSLLDMIDNAECVRSVQLIQFKQGLLGQVIIAHINHFCKDECVFYVKLYNQTYELSAQCHITNVNIPVFSPNAYTIICNNSGTEADNKSEFATATMPENDGISYKTVQLEVDSVHVAYVEYVLNPSNFWIRTDENQKEFSEMMENIAAVYNSCKTTESVLENPQQGDLCCALYEKDNHYYRAIVTEVLDYSVSVYFMDFGNTETVFFYDVKTLFPQFTVLPALALCCTLAHAYPVDDVWVKDANDIFKQLVSGKPLLCHILAKQKYKYVVDVRHSENLDNFDILSLMVQAGCAEYWKMNLNAQVPCTQKDSQLHNLKSKRTSVQIPISNVSENATCVSASNPHVSVKDKSTPYSQLNDVYPNVSRLQYKEYVFKPGTSMDVICSHVISPCDFWCQPHSKASELKSFMEEIQQYYSTSSNVYKHGQKACIARYSCNGQFYRAAVINKVYTNEVEVIFVDYGNCVKVSKSDLREMIPHFMELEGQAFHCSLNFISPLKSHAAWSHDACQDFKKFVNSSVSGKVKCTIHALLNISMGLCNAVNLETPFNNACQFLVHKGYAVCSQRSIPYSKLYTFYYSDFEIIVGNTEQVFISYVYNTGKFYCQLAKNSETVDALMKKVSSIGKQIKTENGKRINRLCVVKYFEDGNFYRALACPVESSDFFVAFFVDFGNSQMVAEHELLDIPEDAADILLEPMQAIPCYLFDLKETVLTAEAKKWFEENCIGKLLSAVVKSKECDGQLGLQLYNENVHINQKIKDLLHIHVNSENSDVIIKANTENVQPKNDPESTAKVTSKTHVPCKGKNQRNGISAHDKKSHLLLSETRKKNSFQISKPGLEVKNEVPKTLQKFDQAQESLKSNCNSAKDTVRSCIQSCDLPNVFISQGSHHMCYVSHINSPLSFYIQLAENEKKIEQLAEQLNKETMTFQPFIGNSLEKGDLVVAQYAEDLAFYRAEVKEVGKDNLYDVEFIDYGNSATVNFANIFKLPDTFSTVPKLCIWVFLGHVKSLAPDGKWTKDAICYFSERVTGKPIFCEFLSVHGTQWEVDLTWRGQSVSAELNQCFGIIRQTKPAKEGQKPAKEGQKPAKEGQNRSSKSDHMGSFLAKSNNITDLTKEKVIDTGDYSCQVQSQRLQPGQLEKVKNIYFSDGMFFVTLAGNSLACNKISLLIAAALKQTDNRLAPRTVTKGMVCLAKSVKMQKWFRAFTEEIFPNTKKMLVLFIDIGVREIISMHNAKKITGEILSVPKQAIPCKWVWIEKTGETMFKKVLNLLMQKEVKILILHFIALCSCWKVEISVNGCLFMEYCDPESPQFIDIQNTDLCCNSEEHVLLSPTYSIPLAPLQSLKWYSGFVTAVNDPSDFYLQLGDSVDTMNRMLFMFNEPLDKILPLPHELLKSGCICLIKCFVDEEWCRSRIVNITNAKVLLILLDYGVFKTIPFSDIDQLKIIPKDIADLPTLTYPCTLHGVVPSDGKQWSKEAIYLFMHSVEKHDLMFQVVKYSSNQKLEVNIYEDSVAQRLVNMGYGVYSETLSHTVMKGASEMPCEKLKPMDDETNLQIVRYKGPESVKGNSSLQQEAQCEKLDILHKSALQNLNSSPHPLKGKSPDCVLYKEKVQI